MKGFVLFCLSEKAQSFRTAHIFVHACVYNWILYVLECGQLNWNPLFPSCEMLGKLQKAFYASVSLIFSYLIFLLTLCTSLTSMLPGILSSTIFSLCLHSRNNHVHYHSCNFTFRLMTRISGSLSQDFPEYQLPTRHHHLDGLSAYPTQHFQNCITTFSSNLLL